MNTAWSRIRGIHGVTCWHRRTPWIALLLPVIAQAEPAASMSHLPFLWILATGVAGLLAWFVVKAIGRGGHLHTPIRKWGLTLILFAVFLVFVSPLIIGLGSILITGRTM